MIASPTRAVQHAIVLRARIGPRDGGLALVIGQIPR
jgi:hypothetical protein